MMHGATLVLLALCVLPLVGLADPAGARRRAERQVYRLVEAGWAPSPQTHASAVRQRVQEQRVSSTTAVLGSLAGVLALALAGLPPPWQGWGYAVGMVVGLHTGRVVVHLRAGRLRTGPRLAELRERHAWDYLSPQDRTAVSIHLTVVAGSATLVGALFASIGEAGDPAPLLILGGAVLWAALSLVVAQLVARAALAAPTRDALRWQDAWRAVTVRDLAQLLGTASLVSVLGLWAATSEWSAPAWTNVVVLVGFGATVLAMVLSTFGRPVLDPSGTRVREA